jgi:uncharacterized protein (DUF111 family)
MPIAYFDCSSGASGDMILGALVDAGVPLSHLDRTIAQSDIKKSIRETACDIFERLAAAQAKVGGTSFEKVHFSEVENGDSIESVLRTLIALDYLGLDEIHVSLLPLSITSPASLEMLKGIPLEKADVRDGHVTPIGAAILTTIATHFGECPLQTIKSIGTSSGLRLLMGEGFSATVIEADIDDMNPQIFDHVMGALFKAGAVDVNIVPIQMKKTRPGVRLSCISPWDKKDRLMDIMLSETSTFGVRYWPVERKVLIRELVTGKVRKGSITFKVGRDSEGKIVKASPEFEDVKKLAKKQKRPVKDVYAEAAAVAASLTK